LRRASTLFWAVSLEEPGNTVNMNTICKRMLDLVLACAGLVIAMPVMVFIVLLLRMEGSGNPVFAQKRLGKNGREFRVYKFRKFPPDWGAKGAGVTVDGDARMTVVGRLLERSKLDELPQLINIIKGEMSFVGPRPESMRFADCFKGAFSDVLNYTPGIFGPNQVKYRNESKMYPGDQDPEQYYREVLFPDKARNDLRYFQHANCLKDLYWIVQGVASSVVGTIDWKRFYHLHAKIFLLDVSSIMIAWVLANLIRFLPSGSEAVMASTVEGLWAFPFVMVFVLAFFKLYEHPVRLFSFEDATRLVSGVTIALALTFLTYVLLDNRSISVALLPLIWVLLIPLLLMPRVLWRIKFERDFSDGNTGEGGLVVYGAEHGGRHLARWVASTSKTVNLLGFIDDSPELRDRKINGMPVLGMLRDLDTLCDVYSFNEIWVAIRLDDFSKGQLDQVCEQRSLSVYYLTDIEPFRHMM